MALKFSQDVKHIDHKMRHIKGIESISFCLKSVGSTDNLICENLLA